MESVSPFLRNCDLSEFMYVFGTRLKLDIWLAFMLLKVQAFAIFPMVSSSRFLPTNAEMRRRAAGRSYGESAQARAPSPTAYEAPDASVLTSAADLLRVVVPQLALRK